MRRRTMLVTLLFLSAIVALGLNSKNQSIPVTSSTSTSDYREIASRPIKMEQNQENDSKIEKNSEPQKTFKKSTTITKSELGKLHQGLPKKKKVEEEINKNPHTPSKTLMTFAKRLGPLMEKAFKNEDDANLLVEELSECANDESIANAARATCVTNTERLATVHPEIKMKAIDLRTEVSPEVQKILDTNDSFIKK